jgi:hypothetical protein
MCAFTGFPGEKASLAESMPELFAAIAARDNIPIVAGVAGECMPELWFVDLGEISAGRVPGRSAVSGCLSRRRGRRTACWAGADPAIQLVAAAYHATFLALLVVAALSTTTSW